MRRKQLIKNILLTTLLLISGKIYAIDIKIKKGNPHDIYRCPSKTDQNVMPITYYNNVEEVYSITSRVSIPKAVITVTKDGAVISDETMAISRENIIEYNFSNDESGEYMITIAVEGIIKSIDTIYVE